MSALRDKLKFTVDSYIVLGLDERCSAIERLVLERGRQWTGRALPRKYRRGPQKMCFMNAAQRAMSDHALTYVEGFGGRPDMPIAFKHAWLVDGDGEVVDPTWRGTSDRDEYCGVVIPTPLLAAELAKSETYGVLWTGPLEVPNFDLIERLRGEER